MSSKSPMPMNHEQKTSSVSEDRITPTKTTTGITIQSPVDQVNLQEILSFEEDIENAIDSTIENGFSGRCLAYAADSQTASDSTSNTSELAKTVLSRVPKRNRYYDQSLTVTQIMSQISTTLQSAQKVFHALAGLDPLAQEVLTRAGRQEGHALRWFCRELEYIAFLLMFGRHDWDVRDVTPEFLQVALPVAAEMEKELKHLSEHFVWLQAGAVVPVGAIVHRLVVFTERIVDACETIEDDDWKTVWSAKDASEDDQLADVILNACQMDEDDDAKDAGAEEIDEIL